MTENGAFAQIYDLVRLIPEGKVASYGMIASLIPGVTPRIVGFAMGATPSGSDIPWQRVINSAGKISERPGAERQRAFLEAEGISFSRSGTVKWSEVGWDGPGPDWAEAAGRDPLEYLHIVSRWPGASL